MKKSYHSSAEPTAEARRTLLRLAFTVVSSRTAVIFSVPHHARPVCGRASIASKGGDYCEEESCMREWRIDAVRSAGCAVPPPSRGGQEGDGDTGCRSVVELGTQRAPSPPWPSP